MLQEQYMHYVCMLQEQYMHYVCMLQEQYMHYVYTLQEQYMCVHQECVRTGNLSSYSPLVKSPVLVCS